MKHFNNIKTLEELKSAYRRLAMLNHPDRGGNVEIMQEINNEHDALFEILKKQQNERAAADKTGKTYSTTETAEEFRNVINELMKINNITVELCGRWLWISGNTYDSKDDLKRIGCKWSASKKMWSWHHEEDGRSYYRGHKTINDIRAKYGSVLCNSDINTAVSVA